MTRDEISQIEQMEASPEMDMLISERFFEHSAEEWNKRFFAGYSEYSTDISAAWTVAEKIKSVYANWLVVECAEYSWRVRVYFHDQERPHVEVLADTAPLALCRAALLIKLEYSP